MRRFLVILLALSASVALAARAGTGDTGAEPCAGKALEICVPWEPEVQGECPRAGGNGSCAACTPIGVGAPSFADGRCCWPVSRWEEGGPCGC